MVKCVKIPTTKAQEVKELLRERELFLDGYRHDKEKGYLYFAVSGNVPGYEIVEREMPETRERKKLKDLLERKLTNKELELVRSAHDTVGSIGIIEVPEELVAKEKIIAEALLAVNKNISTVLKKKGGHIGELRLQEYVFLAGVDTRETIVKENGVRLKIDVEGVYYSVRTAAERKRVALQVKKGEKVLVMFSGAAPYPCVISKLSEATEIVGIELNEKGHELGVANVALNKLDNIVLIQGDVKEVVPELSLKFDRIVMPLPHTGHDFLDEAFAVAKKGTVIHLYDFEKEREFDKAAEKVLTGAARNKKKVKIKKIVACGQHSPRLFRVCVDFIVQ